MATKKVLFVCMGNICRSPAAEGVLQAQVSAANLQSTILVDSAGTTGYHTGDRADSRMRQAASARGYDLQSRARQVTADDLTQFDFVIAMDQQNLAHLHKLQKSNPNATAQIHLFSDFLDGTWPKDVPDPYYGGDDGFRYVMEMLEAGCPALLEKLKDAA